MSIKTYIADKSHKLRNLSHAYAKGGTYKVIASGNAKSFMLTSGEGGQQALLYTSIQFGTGVSQVPDRCCYKFMNLQAVAFNTSKVTSIGKEAFYMCSALKSISLAEPISQVGEDAFYGCSAMSRVEFPKKTSMKLGVQAFSKAGITSLVVSTAAPVGPRAFAECAALASASVTGAIGEQMFAGCTSLKTVSVSGQVTSIPASMFNGCSSLENVVFSSIGSITAIGENAFCGCTKLRSFALGSTRVTSIGSSAFARSGITELEIPENITSPLQLNPRFLVGSSIRKITFYGIGSSYMKTHIEDFQPFVDVLPMLEIYSYDGYKLVAKDDDEGQPSIQVATGTAYVISIALSNNVSSRPLKGMYKDSERFMKLIDNSYKDDQDLILGRSILNDKGMSNPVGNRQNIDAAFDKAVESNAELLIFHFSDHGNGSTQTRDGSLSIYDGRYSYSELFQQFMRFKYVFAMFCCCYPNAALVDFGNIDGNNTKALFWCGGNKNQQTYMQKDVGHDFMTALDKTYDSSYTWSQQLDSINYKKSGSDRYYISINGIRFKAIQYVYNGFPVIDKVFKVIN